MSQLETVRTQAKLWFSLLFYAFILSLLGAYVADAGSCNGAPLLNEEGLKKSHTYCQAYRYACVDQEIIILYDPDFADRPRADGIPIARTETLQAFFRHGKTGDRLGKLIGKQFNATEAVIAGTSYKNIPLPIRLAAEHEEGIEGRHYVAQWPQAILRTTYNAPRGCLSCAALYLILTCLTQGCCTADMPSHCMVCD
jgi:hypothetical protein